MKQYIYGKNTVLEALNGDKAVYEVLLAVNMKDEQVITIAKKKQIPVKFIQNRRVLDDLANNGRHQGIVAQVEGYDYYSIDEILSSIPNGKQPLLVMLDGLEDPHNLGAIMRTCDAIGVDGIIIGKNRSVSLNQTVAKVSTGAIDHVKVAQVTNLTRTLEDLKKKGYWVVGCDVHQASDYRELDYNMPCVIVIGSEGFGISRLVLEACDYKVVLPMVGHVTSLNASVATAVILYEVYNSRNPLK